MKLLLDTHVLLWWLADDHRLHERVAKAIARGDNEVLVSAASVWEVEIKRAKGTLHAPDDLLDQIAACGFGLLAIAGSHARAAGRLPQHHHDPFDRMLVAQATAEDAALVTSDSALSAYGTAVLAAG
ncbi:MAG TPA: type II toxin-antitoxin system VapC family toxin [Thermoleophilaceae bacterium]|nr:type II toxin-antitoxin system VapC family toxin [Thermoleophilaceae bacterium]